MLNIKNPEAHRLARELADRRGESLTGAVTYALREQLAREPAPPKRKIDVEKVKALLAEIRAAAPPAFFETEDPTAFLYGEETGLPK